MEFGFFFEKSMIVEKVINNNVLSALDEKKREIVVSGRGIAFKKRPGDPVDESKIEKIYVLSNEAEVDRFSELLRNLPMEHLSVSTEIIEYAQQVIRSPLSPSIYITLTDHVNFVVERFQKGMMFQNALLEEVKNFYPSEYLIGEYAIALLQKKLGVRLPEDEAASIALHFVNAEYSTNMNNTMNITTLIKEVLDLVQDDMNINLNELGLYYSRFVTHLKFLAQRIFTGQLLDNQEEEFIEMIERMYPREYECSRKIQQYIQNRYEQKITDEELAYLTVHIRRIQPNVKEDE